MARVTVVVGLGEIGKPLFNILQKAHECRGVDKEPVEVREPVGVMHVCYPFTLDNNFVETTVAYAAKYKPELIVINSTVVPGTTRAIAQATGIATAYSPVRGKHTRMQDDLGRYKKFVGATTPASSAQLVQHLEAAGFGTEVMATPESLELGKLLETTYFGLLIAWAQEMDRFARAAGADYQEMTKFFAEVDYLPRHVFVPGFIGGHCVMPNIELLKSKFQSEVLDAVQASNARKAKELRAEEIATHQSRERPRVEPKKLK